MAGDVARLHGTALSARASRFPNPRFAIITTSKLRRIPASCPPFEDAEKDIEKILTAQRVDNALDRWLGQARTQSRIRYTQEVFQ